MFPGAFVYRAHQRHQSIVPGPLVNKVPQGAHNANKGKSAPLQPGFVLHTITDRSVCGFLGDYTVGAPFVCLAFSCLCTAYLIQCDHLSKNVTLRLKI